MSESAHCFLVDSAGRPQGIFEDYQVLRWTRRWQKPGSFKMTISRHQVNAQAIRMGLTFGPAENPHVEGPDHLLFVDQIELNVDKAGRESENLEASGRDLAGMFEHRAVLPATGLAYDTRTGPGESVMKGYVAANAAGALGPPRFLPNYVVTPDLGRGSTITYQARYQSLARVLEECGIQATMGYEIKLNQISGAFEFDVLPGVDHSAGNGVNDPVIFAVQFDTAESLRWLRSQTDSKTVAYVLGQGEGAARQVEVVELTPGPIGFARRELVVDARDLDNATALQDRGRVKLSEHSATELLEVSLSPASAQAYRRDWDLGDIVTVYNPEWGVEVDLRIVEVTLTLEPEPGHTLVDIALGAPWPTLEERIRQADAAAEAGTRV